MWLVEIHRVINILHQTTLLNSGQLMSMSQDQSNEAQIVGSSTQIWVELKIKRVLRFVLGWLACRAEHKLSCGFCVLIQSFGTFAKLLSEEINDIHVVSSYAKLFMISVRLRKAAHSSGTYTYYIKFVTHQPQNHGIILGVIFALHKPVIIPHKTNRTLQQLTLIST